MSFTNLNYGTTDLQSFSTACKASLLWLDGSVSNNMLYSSGVKISTWLDSGSKGMVNAVQSTVANQPSYAANVKNGLGVVDYTAFGSLYFTANINLSIASTPCVTGTILFQCVNVTTTQYIIGGFGGNGRNIIVTGGSLIFNNGSGNTTVSAISINTWYLLSWYWDKSSNSLSTWLNRVAKNSAVASTADGVSNIGIGYNNSLATGQINGKMAELALFNKILSPLELQTIESYFSYKWGLGL